MKRTNLRLLLRIVTICLCVCAIAVGVYSIKSASLTVDGSIGFVVNNCKFTLTSVVNCASTTGTDAEIKDFDPISTNVDATNEEKSNVTHSVGKLNFNDAISGGNVVKITLTFTNNSAFNLSVTLNDDIKFVSYTKDGTSIATSGTDKITSVAEEGGVLLEKYDEFVLGTKDTNKTKTFTLTLSMSEADILAVDSISGKLQLSFSVEQYVGLSMKVGDFLFDANATEGNTSDTFTIDDVVAEGITTKRNYIEMGSHANDSGEITPLKWFMFAKSNSNGVMEAVTDKVVEENKTLPSGTYYFISEYMWNKMYFCGDYDNETGKRYKDGEYANKYDGSDVQKYLSDITSQTGTMCSDFSIALDKGSVYKKYIKSRNIDDAEDADNYVAACKCDNQKLWLLSVDELAYLNGGVNIITSLSYTSPSRYVAYKNVMCQTGTSDSVEWQWIRSPKLIVDKYAYTTAFHINAGSQGEVSDAYPVAIECSIRPAFQITVE